MVAQQEWDKTVLGGCVPTQEVINILFCLAGFVIQRQCIISSCLVFLKLT